MKKESPSIRLKQLMKENNLKQIDIINKCKPVCERYSKRFGKNIQITKSDLSQWISGIYEPSQTKLMILAEALNTNEVWLIGYDVPNVTRDQLDDFFTKRKEMETLAFLLKQKGLLDENEELSEETFNRVIEFIKANKNFLMKDNDKN